MKRSFVVPIKNVLILSPSKTFDRGSIIKIFRRAGIILVMLCLQGCTVGSYFRSKSHLAHQKFIALRTAPSMSSKNQSNLKVLLPKEYGEKRNILEQEKKDLGPFGPWEEK